MNLLICFDLRRGPMHNDSHGYSGNGTGMNWEMRY
mgnify:CR=1 FL=1